LSFIAGQTHGVIAVEHESIPVRRRRPVMGQGIGFQVDEGLDVVRGRQADRADAADLPDVLSHLRRVADADAHELERRVPEDLGDHHPADEPGAPDHDSPGHLSLLSLVFSWVEDPFQSVQLGNERPTQPVFYS
jgi:hypothetical protein